MDCRVCGHENPPGSNFCAKCGAEMDEDLAGTQLVEPVEDTVEHDVAPAAGDDLEEQAVLVVRRGPNAGSRYVIGDDDTVKIGRHPDSDFFLDDVTVSRRHALISAGGGTYRVKDDGSLNGTYLNGERVEEAELQSHDELRIGKYVIVFLRVAPDA